MKKLLLVACILSMGCANEKNVPADGGKAINGQTEYTLTEGGYCLDYDERDGAWQASYFTFTGAQGRVDVCVSSNNKVLNGKYECVWGEPYAGRLVLMLNKVQAARSSGGQYLNLTFGKTSGGRYALHISGRVLISLDWEGKLREIPVSEVEWPIGGRSV